MMKARNFVLAAAMGLITILSLPAFAQYDRDGDGSYSWRQDDHRGWGWQNGRDDDDNRGYYGNNSGAYRDGYQDGLRDRRDGRNWSMRNNRYRDRDDRDAYSRGYAEGYRSDGDRGGRGGWGWNGGNGAYYSNAYKFGQRSGYQDGLRFGAHDRQHGIPFRATRTQEYRDGDHYYKGSYGDKNQYRNGYRQAFLDAYRQGYYGR
jgi:hypothetical protein